MPPLISSASGKKAAGPKGAIRRRPAAPGPPAPTAPSAQTTPSAAASVAPQSPPPAQPAVVEEPAPEKDVQQTETVTAPTEPLREREPEQTPQEPAVQPVTQPAPEPPRDSTPAAELEATAVHPTTQEEQQAEAGTTEHEQVQDVPAEIAPHPTVDPGSRLDQASVQPSEQNQVQEQVVESTQPAEEIAQSTSASQPAPPTEPATKRTRKDTATASAPRPAKRAKRSSARSNLTVQAEIQADDERTPGAAKSSVENDTSSVTPAPQQSRPLKRKQPTRKPTTTQRKAKSRANSDEDGEAVRSQESPEDEDASEEPVPKKAKQRRKKKQVRSAVNAETADEEGRAEGAGEDGEAQQEADESDPELHEIDPNTLSMWDLSHDSKYGKMSERGKKMADIDWDEVAQKRRAEAMAIIENSQEQAPAGEVVQSVEGPDGTTESHAGDGEQSQAAQTNTAGNEAFLVDADGNIVLDEATVRHDATAQAMQAAETGAVEDVNDLTSSLNRTTWINNNRRDPTDRVPLWKWKSDPWSEEETDRFYDALTMFGSDFFIISKMFAGKTRRMIKSKFNREEKIDPKRVDDALMGKSTKAMDLEHYSRETGRDMSIFMRYDGLEHAQGIINESLKEKHEAMTLAAQQEAAAAEEKAAKEKAEKREKSRNAKKARKGRSKGGGTMGGVPDEGDAEG